jgi:hypothetical protein
MSIPVFRSKKRPKRKPIINPTEGNNAFLALEFFRKKFTGLAIFQKLNIFADYRSIFCFRHKHGKTIKYYSGYWGKYGIFAPIEE